MKPHEKETNQRAFEFDISIALPFSAVTEPINGHALECGN
jgi:hypothetical protein